SESARDRDIWPCRVAVKSEHANSLTGHRNCDPIRSCRRELRGDPRPCGSDGPSADRATGLRSLVKCPDSDAIPACTRLSVTVPCAPGGGVEAFQAWTAAPLRFPPLQFLSACRPGIDPCFEAAERAQARFLRMRRHRPFACETHVSPHRQE